MGGGRRGVNLQDVTVLFVVVVLKPAALHLLTDSAQAYSWPRSLPHL